MFWWLENSRGGGICVEVSGGRVSPCRGGYGYMAMASLVFDIKWLWGKNVLGGEVPGGWLSVSASSVSSEMLSSQTQSVISSRHRSKLTLGLDDQWLRLSQQCSRCHIIVSTSWYFSHIAWRVSLHVTGWSTSPRLITRKQQHSSV